MTSDPKCYDLAAAFLADEPLSDHARERHTVRLAGEIQNAIEAFIADDDGLSHDLSVEAILRRAEAEAK